MDEQNNVVPLDAVAPDSRAMIEAFRSGGEVSFQDGDVPTSRETYAAGCREDGPQWPGTIETRDQEIGGVPCRVYEPASDEAGSNGGAPVATLLYLHGGGWVVGDLETHDPVCRCLAGASHSRVVSADYRLAPEHRFPAAHDDSIAVARALLGASADDADPVLAAVSSGPVIVIGDSAGGNLAAWVARASARGEFARPVAGQVLIYPVTDLTFAQPSYSKFTRGFPLTAASMEWFASHYGTESDRTDPALSPLLYPIEEVQAPAFVSTVGLDPLADEGIKYAAELARAGTAVEHHHLPRHAHGLVTAAGTIATGQRLLDQVVHFVTELVTDTGR